MNKNRNISKKQIIEAIFYSCKERNNFVFDNNFVKEILRKYKSKTNPYDITKIDSIEKLPDVMLKEDFFIVHLGNGLHKFIKGINKIFHKFEPISENEKIIWPYRPSILNDYSISESSVLSLCFNHRIIHDFLYQDIVANPKIYNSERKRGVSFTYYLDNLKLSFENLQIEIDLTTEYNGYVTVFEGKNTKNENTWLKDFNIFQLYNPYRYYFELMNSKKLKIEKLTSCYLVRQKNKNASIVRLYNYIFEDPRDISTIKIIKKNEYVLEKRGNDE
jgi:hypothetical protein